MTGKREWSTSLDASLKNNVCFSNNKSLTAKETYGKEIIIEEVLYVPGIKANLLCLGQLLQKGFVMKMTNNFLTNLVLQAQLSQNRTFQVRIHYLQHQCLTTLENKKEWLWHLRFCHINFKDLHLLANQKMVKGLPQVIVPEVVCKVYIRCKETSKKSSRIVPTIATNKLQIETPRGSRSFISFIDDLTKKIWVYLLKGKHEVLDAFKRFKCSTKKHRGKMIKMLRTDGGREYVSTKFKELCESYTHCSGTAERRNRTLLNLARCMLKSKNLPSFLHGEAVSTTAYILNRSPTKLEGITLEEAWIGVKPNVTHLRIFRSVCSRNISGQPTHILVGYHSTRGYKLYESESGQVSTNRNIICDEIRSWTWSASSKVFHGSTITSKEELVHFAHIAEVEPIVLQIRNSALKWVYKVKVNPKGELVKHKAKLVAKGFLQKPGIDYGEVYATVARIEIVRLVVVIATNAN
ncbi:hypothetical protein CR513_53919, partial [Mucuna pruriens]